MKSSKIHQKPVQSFKSHLQVNGLSVANIARRKILLVDIVHVVHFSGIHGI
jgi:hypothetical protein